jgi:uncharacterized membrane protein YebE (DUF533 family)
MLDATQMLGALMPESTAGKAVLGAAGVAAAGGVAYMAYRHFKNPGEAPAGFAGGSGTAAGSAAAAGFGAPAQSAFGAPAAAPAAAAGFGAAAGTPRAAGFGAPVASAFGPAPAAASPAATSAAAADVQADALVLVRAMIAAAHVDGQVDATERTRILDRATAAGLGAAERAALEHELGNPWPPYALLGAVRSRELAEQFYVVSLLAIAADTDAERAYLRGLPYVLGMRPPEVAQLHARLGVTL